MFCLGVFVSVFFMVIVVVFHKVIERMIFDKNDEIKVGGNALYFSALSYLFNLEYICLASFLQEVILGEAICAISLILSVCVLEMLFEALSGREGNDTLTAQDKNVSVIISYFFVMIIGCASCSRLENIDFLKIISISLSLILGLYFPVQNVYKGFSLKRIFDEICSQFIGFKLSVVISDVLLAVFLICISVIPKLHSLIEAMRGGLALGWVISICIALYYIIKKGKMKKL